MKILESLSDRLNGFCLVGACVFLVLMTILVLGQVVSRYLFSFPPSWTEEAARFCMIWSGLLGATVAFKNRQDPVIVKRRVMQTRHANIALALGEFIPAAIFLCPLVFYGPGFIRRSIPRMAETLPFSTAWVVVIVPLCGVIILFHAFIRVAASMRSS